MRIRSLILLLLLGTLRVFPQTDLKLWYQSPATQWEDALPVGNGRLGAMVFGDTRTERIQFNENTLYSGKGGMLKDHTQIFPKLNKVRSLMLKEKPDEAERIIQKEWNGRLTEAYQPFGDVFIDFLMRGHISSYEHSLDLASSIVSTKYEINGVQVVREVFASYPDQSIVINIKASQPILDLDLRMESLHPVFRLSANKTITIKGKAPAHVQRRTVNALQSMGTEEWHPEYFDKKGRIIRTSQVIYGDSLSGIGMPFEARLIPISYDGKLQVKEGKMLFRSSSNITLILFAETAYNGYKKKISLESDLET